MTTIFEHLKETFTFCFWEFFVVTHKHTMVFINVYGVCMYHYILRNALIRSTSCKVTNNGRIKQTITIRLTITKEQISYRKSCRKFCFLNCFVRYKLSVYRIDTNYPHRFGSQTKFFTTLHPNLSISFWKFRIDCDFRLDMLCQTLLCIQFVLFIPSISSILLKLYFINMYVSYSF